MSQVEHKEKRRPDSPEMGEDTASQARETSSESSESSESIYIHPLPRELLDLLASVAPPLCAAHTSREDPWGQSVSFVAMDVSSQTSRGEETGMCVWRREEPADAVRVRLLTHAGR